MTIPKSRIHSYEFHWVTPFQSAPDEWKDLVVYSGFASDAEKVFKREVLIIEILGGVASGFLAVIPIILQYTDLRCAYGHEPLIHINSTPAEDHPVKVAKRKWEVLDTERRNFLLKQQAELHAFEQKHSAKVQQEMKGIERVVAGWQEQDRITKRRKIETLLTA